MSTSTPPTSKKAVSTRGNLGINFAKRYNHETVSRENINKHIEVIFFKSATDYNMLVFTNCYSSYYILGEFTRIFNP